MQYEAIWNSGSNPPTFATISIENTTLTGCEQFVDFVIDDINFIPGCGYASSGAQPNLGADMTICGKGGSIILDANVPHNSTTTVTWDNNLTGSGLTAPYTRTITSAGTYSVCVTDNGSCTKSDVIVITDTYNINLGNDLVLCSPTSAILDAGFSGIGVTYKWYKNNVLIPNENNKTLFLNNVGTYKVEVNDLVCGTRTDEITITSNTATPVNGYYCNSSDIANLSVIGNGNYKWYTTPTKGTGSELATGKNYNVSGLIPTSTYTYYVEDMSNVNGSVGLNILNTNVQAWTVNPAQLQMKIKIGQNISITSLDIPIRTYNSSNSATIQIEVRDANGNSFSPAKYFTSDPTSVTNNNGGTTLQTFNFTNFDLLSSWGTNLRLSVSNITNIGNVLWNQNINPSYPFLSTQTGLFDIIGSGGSNGTNNDYIYFYNIKYQTGVPCDRIPVQAIYNCTLPLEWISFNKQIQNDFIILTWVVNENNTNSYTIQKSVDMINWKNLNTIKSYGNGLNEYSSSYMSENLNTYFRIIKTNINNSISYSNIINSNNINSDIKIYPNPFKSNIKINIEKEYFRYKIFDVNGKMLYNDINYNKIIDANNLENGIYILSIDDGENIYFFKIIKES